MKTFQEFITDCMLKEDTYSQQYLNKPTQRFKVAIANQINKHRDNPEKLKFYKDYLESLMARDKTSDLDAFGRTASRRDKHLYPSYRMSSHPGEENPSTVTKNPKKLRKQRALGEIS